MSNSSVPKLLHVIWIGDESKRPNDLISTWQKHHPDWRLCIWGNHELHNRKWRNQTLMDAYLKEKRYPGVADVMRYEILYRFGGFCFPADSRCLANIEPLLEEGYDAYAVYENEVVRPGLLSPLYACVPGAEFARALVTSLPEVPPLAKNGTPERPSKAPWQVTGNAFMKRMVEKQQDPKLLIWPSYRFNPIHHTGHRYNGTGKVYAVQQWGTTTSAGIGIREYDWGQR